MIYKIMTLVREDKVKPLWSPLMIKKTNADGTTEYVEYSTESTTELETKILEIVQMSGTSTLRAIVDVTYDLDITIPLVV